VSAGLQTRQIIRKTNVACHISSTLHTASTGSRNYFEVFMGMTCV